MTTIWEQREKVQVLEKLTNEELGRLPYDGVAQEEEVHRAYSSESGYWIWESVLIKEVLRKTGIDENNIPAISKQRDSLDACISNGFILQTQNESFTDTIPLPQGANPNANSSRRRIKVSSEGYRLLNFWYFWFKYLPSELPTLTTVVITFLTSSIFWAIILWLLGVELPN